MTSKHSFDKFCGIMGHRTRAIGQVMQLVIGNRNYSSWSLRAWLLMKEAGLQFDEIRIPLDVESTASEIARYSSAGRVPVLIRDGQSIWDTMAIAETLAESHPQLWPEDSMIRAHGRAISAEMHSGFATLREAMPMNCRAMGRKVPISDELAADIDRIFAIWSECHRRFGDAGDWLLGTFSIADAMYAPVVLRFRTYGINIPAAASRYPARLLESEWLQEWLVASESETEVIEHEEIGQ